MSSSEFTHYLALERIEPSGWEMDNWRAGLPAAATWNVALANVPKGKRRATALQPKDFYPVLARSRPRLSPTQERELKQRRAKREKK